MKIAIELDQYNQPTNNIIILDGKHKGTVLDQSIDLTPYRAKDWLGRLESIQWMSDIASKNGQIVSGRNKEFEENKARKRIGELINRATADPITKTLNGWNQNLTADEYEDDINSRYNTPFNKNCSKLQNK